MENLTIINIDNKEYYNVEEVAKAKPEFFKACDGRLRTIVSFKKIKIDDYAYGYIKDGEWIKSTEKYARSKLLLSVNYCKNEIFTVKKTKKEGKILKNDKQPIELTEDSKNNELPPLLVIKDNEKFKDDDENILDIEIRGYREYDKIYFNVEDIMVNFEFPSLAKNLTDKMHSYVVNDHYKIFCVPQFGGNKNTKKIYLTYLGLLKVLMVSRHKNALQYQKWASKILYTYQFGTKIQKRKLASELIGVHYENMKQYVDTIINEMPCIYLIVLGKVKDLRNTMNIPEEHNDESCVYKFGFTKDFKKRYPNHKSVYGKIKGVDLVLRNISIIDEQYISNAETDVKLSLSKYLFKYDKHEELLIVSNDNMRDVEQVYSILQYKYGKSTKQLNSQIEFFKNELREKESLLRIEKEINSKKDIQLEKKDVQLELEKEKNANKDLQIELLKQKLYIKELEAKAK